MKRSLDNVKKSIKDEQKAYSDYTKYAADARLEGCPELAQLFEHIRTEEGHHADEFKAALLKIEEIV